MIKKYPRAVELKNEDAEVKDRPNDEILASAIQETITAAIYTVNREGIITAWNKGAQELLGYDADQVIGSRCSVIGSTTCAGADCADGAFMCPLFSDGGVWSRQCVVKHRSGRLVPVLKTGQILKNANGNVIGGVETLTDISEIIGEKADALVCKTPPGRKTSNYQPKNQKMVGDAPCMDNVRTMAMRAADSDVSVLILGESGTGKELIAEMVHANGPLSDKPFVRVDCASLSETLLESELFGHVKGSFTGANANRPGRFEIADGGTVFLDEIGDITPHVQKKLLRFLQSREFERVGDNVTRRVNVRVISATHRNLKKMVELGTFREDLYWRLSAFPIELPPLRKRMDDIILLAEHFLARHWKNDSPIPKLSKDVRRVLLTHTWSGNCRELENVMWYAATLARGEELLVPHLPPQFGMGVPNANCDHAKALLTALERCKWNKTKAAEMLGISRVTLWRRMQKLGITPE